MLGRHKFDPDHEVTVNLSQLVPQDHFLRKVNRHLDLSFVHELTKEYYCGNNGRPSVDPEIISRMLIVGYLYGIQEDRRLCKEIQFNLAYRWFCRLNLDEGVPNHSTLSKLRDKYGEELFKLFFEEILAQCRKAGLVSGERVITDATLIAANASVDSMIANDPKLAEAEVLGTCSPGRKAPASRKLTNKTHTSQTDPDATLAFKQGTPRGLKYKMHTIIDADSRVVLEPKITTGAVHDASDFVPQIQRVSVHLDTPTKEAIADRAYGSGDNIKTLKENGVEPYIPLF